MKCLCVLGFWCLVLPSSLVWANAEGGRPVKVLYKDAQAIVVADVIKTEASCESQMPYCRPEYFFKLSVVQKIKGTNDEAPPSEMRACSETMLQVGSRYTLFLEQPDRYNSTNSKKCNFAIDVDGAFERIGSHMYRVGSPEAKIIVNFEGNKYLTNAVVEPDFEQIMNLFSQGTEGQ
jgi:hypothetical protein